MRLSWLITLPAVLSVASALMVEKRDADFLSVRTKQRKDMSGKRGDRKDKYFHESTFHPHYDGRFAEKQLPYHERRVALSNLIQTYLATMNDLGVETWLMHGTLLGWWWNRKILPWDSDSDVQMSEKSMTYLATFYNMTVFHYKTPRIPDGRDYMLEINPHYVNREQTDKMNVIDARWIDTSSGLFIDMTTARYNYTHPAGEGMLSCKDGHEYRDTYIFPLRDTYFEGTPAKIPFAYKEVLEAEYGPKSLTLKDYADHRFDDQKLEWIPMPKPLKKPEDQKVITPPKKVEEKKVEVKKPEEKKPEEKKPEEKKPEEKKPEEKKPEEKKPEEKKPEVKKAEEKKVEEKKPEQAAQKEAQTTLATKTRAAILKVRESSPPTVNPPSPPPKI